MEAMSILQILSSFTDLCTMEGGQSGYLDSVGHVWDMWYFLSQSLAVSASNRVGCETDSELVY